MGKISRKQNARAHGSTTLAKILINYSTISIFKSSSLERPNTIKHLLAQDLINYRSKLPLYPLTGAEGGIKKTIKIYHIKVKIPAAKDQSH